MKMHASWFVAAQRRILIGLAVASALIAAVMLVGSLLVMATAIVVCSFSVRSNVDDDMARLRSVGRRVLEFYKKGAILAVSVLLWFCCLELVSSGILNAWTTYGKSEQQDLDPRAGSSYYTSQDWAPLYWREFKASRI